MRYLGKRWLIGFLTLVALTTNYSKSAGVAPSYTIMSRNPDQRKISKMVGYLERVPDKIKSHVNEFGGDVVIYDRISSLAELSRDEKILLLISGEAYVPDRKKVYVAENDDVCGSFHGMTVPELHGYGHMTDHAYRNLSDVPEFASLIPESAPFKPSHYFAESFGQFYCSEESRLELQKMFPEIYNYFVNFERNVGF